MIVGHIGGAGAPYEIQKSLRFRANASAYLSRTPGVAGSNNKFTWSGWVKRGAVGSEQLLMSVQQSGAADDRIEFTAAGQFYMYFNNGSVTPGVYTNAVLRDPSAWYHLLVSVDTTQATAANRIQLYVNGVLQSVTGTQPTQNYAITGLNTTKTHNIGRRTLGDVPFDGYLSEINFIDGQALDPSYFGEFSAETGAWIPKKYTGTYGTNGFYLPFNDGSNLTNLTADRSGNGNNWTANNISLTSGVTYDWMDDTPTNNFAVLNPLDRYQTDNTFSNANLRVTTGTTGYGYAVSTIGVSSGQFYFEVTPTVTSGIEAYIGVQDTSPSALKSLLYASTGVVYEYATVKASGLPTYTTNDVIGVAFDASTNSVAFYKNGTFVGTYSYTSPPTNWAAYLADGRTSGGNTYDINFGQRPFTYTLPAGFKALCTKNLPTPSILNPKKHFDVVLATGANIKSTAEAVFPSNFLEWIKDRVNANNHQLIDIVRGTSAVLQSNTTAVETTYSAPSGSSVGWLWKAGGATVTNNAGSIQSQVSANPQAGFSIVTYTGTGANATVGHGLGIAPKMVFFKKRSTTGEWLTLFNLNGVNKYGYLNQTSAFGNASQALPNSMVVDLGPDPNANGNGASQVAYCFAEIPGFSKIGSYTGNGSADGPFVYCGFRPRYVLIKRIDAGPSNWTVHDTAREASNVQQAVLYPHLSNAEAVQSAIDVLSNGFKLRHSTAEQNGSGGTYIFYAVAEQPFQFANAR